MDILNRQNLPLRIVCEQEAQRMTQDEFADLLRLSKTHQVILVTFDEESGKTRVACLVPAEEFTEAIETIVDRLGASRKKIAQALAESKAALGETPRDDETVPVTKTEG